MEAAMRSLASTNPELEQSLDQGTWEKVTLVDRLFEPLEHEQGLNGTLREQLEQLRLPVFEVLLETSEFLDQDNHPARTIINDLMRLCVAERSSSRNLEKTVTGIIDELVQADERDESLYRSVGTKLRSLVERQEQSFQRNSERIAKTLEGKERLHQTRLGVQRRLNMLLAGKPVPQVVLELLEAGWEQLIVLAVLREGPESQTATNFINIVDQIQLWLSEGETSKDLAFEKELESDALIQLIDRELRTVGDVSPVRAVVARLSRELQQQEAVESEVLKSYPINADIPEEEVRPEQAGSRWARRAREIDVGDWVEIALENGKKRRMRLVWGGQDVFRFVFLSPQGLGEASYDYGEFIDKLASGEAGLISQGEIPFVDQSLFDIVQGVYKKLNFEATHDALTGCLHRHDFEKQLAQALTTLADSPDSHSLMVFDIDEFNIINTTYGTHTGDELLKYFAYLLQEHGSLHSGECHIGRLGGNEFALLASNMPVEEALDFTERLRAAFRKKSHAVGKAELSATLSASVCPFDDTTLNAGSLMNQANLALKAAKRRGGDSVEMAKIQASDTTTTGPQWVPEIDRSIRDGSLYLRAQKIIPLNGNKEGEMYELLLGLQNSSGQEISPQNYIEAAEQFRRSSRVDLWVVDEALGWMERNPGTIANIGTFNINLSGASLSDDAFLLGLESRLKQHSGLTGKLCFEVTETSAVSNLHYAADFMNEMKRLRCRFALDDFGTGLSSYAYLQKLPVDYVKVDGVFVRDMASNLTNYALVRSITELCHFLDIKAIAEYVEDMETLELLKEIQVDYGQGYCIAKPRRLDSLERTATARTI
jgi:diguanylate cyclase (GGDEF)-like protein